MSTCHGASINKRSEEVIILKLIHNEIKLMGVFNIKKDNNILLGAQPVDTKIFTEQGFIDAKKARVGMRVYGEDGELHDIIGVYTRGARDVFTIMFSDGSSIQSCAENLLTYQSQYDKKKGQYRMKSVKAIIEQPLWYNTSRGDKNSKFFTPLIKPLKFSKKKLSIHPYVLGVLLGDGCLTAGSITLSNPELDIVHKFERLLGEGFSLVGYKKSNWTIKDNLPINTHNRKGEYKNRLKYSLYKLGLIGKKSNEKFIPLEYMLSSIEDRIELLRGLIDTDGNVNGSQIYYSSTSYQLCLDIQFVVQSLGGTAKIATAKRKCVYRKGLKKDCLPLHSIHIKIQNDIMILSSEKHRSKYREGKTAPKRTIQSIEYAGKKECLSIIVDNPSKHYLADSLNVTHCSMIQEHAPDINNESVIVNIAYAYLHRDSMVERSK